MAHQAGFACFTFSDNACSSAAKAADWFGVDGDRLDLARWSTASGETDAPAVDGSPPDPGRNLNSYAKQLGTRSTSDDSAAAARQQSCHKYRPELDAPNAVNDIRGGCGVPPRQPGSRKVTWGPPARGSEAWDEDHSAQRWHRR
ncbi:MAG: hypothetical protein JW751_00485 [Polyangiaceae bacterium]|nr:hypothetical protein [Polyangiaceae bacterium]